MAITSSRSHAEKDILPLVTSGSLMRSAGGRAGAFWVTWWLWVPYLPQHQRFLISLILFLSFRSTLISLRLNCCTNAHEINLQILNMVQKRCFCEQSVGEILCCLFSSFHAGMHSFSINASSGTQPYGNVSRSAQAAAAVQLGCVEGAAALLCKEECTAWLLQPLLGDCLSLNSTIYVWRWRLFWECLCFCLFVCLCCFSSPEK